MDKQLSQADVASLTVPGKYRFGPGLYLQVAGPDAKSWFYRYTVHGKERFMGLGSARDVKLAQARKRVDELRINQISKKIDPLAERKAIAEAERVVPRDRPPALERNQRLAYRRAAASDLGREGRNRAPSPRPDRSRARLRGGPGRCDLSQPRGAHSTTEKGTAQARQDIAMPPCPTMTPQHS